MASSLKDTFLSNARTVFLAGCGVILAAHEIKETKEYLHNAFGMEFNEKTAPDPYKDMSKANKKMANFGQAGGY